MEKKMKIKEAKKEDFEEYLKLKREEEKDLKSYLKIDISYPKDEVLRKEFSKIIRDKKSLLLIVELNKKLIAYVYSTFFNNAYTKGGYIEDIFVLRAFRRKGVAKSLINHCIDVAKKRGYNKVQLSVNIKNKRAIKLYKKLGFKIYHYDLKKEWK
jgi:aminoglycoside 6'-N-acetyltransferase I